MGIGASAGGIRPLKEFLASLPPDSGIAFVVVMHLARDHESILPEVLQVAASIPVVQVTGRVTMRADHVYVIPPNKNLEITDGDLTLSDPSPSRRHWAPIDVFFRTLAAKHPDGIGILLSGGGSDGTIGMRAIKEHGGVLMAQIPEEAEYPQMPQSAIDTALVDFVLPARELAAKVVELSRLAPGHRAGEPPPIGDGELAVLQRILSLVQARNGHDFSGYKRATMARRIARRMRVCGTDSIRRYLEHLRSHPGEVEELQRDFLISVTTFFRDPTAFERLEQLVIPKIVDGGFETGPVRVWVPGCATGEEAYGIAMLLLERAELRASARPEIQLFASDLDDDALEYAREGLYPEAIATDVSAERLRRFFTKEGSYYRVKSELRERILFANHSLLKDPPFSRLQLVSCRNLLIYLERELQRRVLEMLHYALLPSGFLFLGTSETAEWADELFETLDKKAKIYRRRAHSPTHEVHYPALPLKGVPSRVHPAGAALQHHHPLPQRDRAERELHAELLERHAPPSLVVAGDHGIVHLSERAGRYLRHAAGRPSANLFKVVREELLYELRTAMHDVFERGGAILAKPVELTIDGEARQVQLHVSRASSTEDERLALVVFVEGGAVPPTAGEESPATETRARLHTAEGDLEATKARMQAIIEESETQHEALRATNEELQSINEEYKSTLEELETSKEELQSMNEELKTVNSELKEKIDALGRANDDLKNLVAVTEIPTLFLDRQLGVQRFTPSLTKLFNIIPGDSGRPLSHLTHTLVYDELVEDAANVLDTLVTQEREVRDRGGRTHLVRLVPYRTAEDRIEGVVITFVDVTRIKAADERLRQAQERYFLLIEQVTEYAIFITDTEGRITSWNAGAQRLFGHNDEQALGQHLALVFTDEDRALGLPQARMDEAARRGAVPDERWHARRDGSRFWGSGVVTALRDTHGGLLGFAKVLRDNTARRDAAEELAQSRKRLEALNASLEQRVEERTQELARSYDEVRRLAATLSRAEHEERRRISGILHDHLQQVLFCAQMKLRAALGEKKPDAAAFEEAIARAEGWVEEAILAVRRLMVELSPPVLKTEGLVEMLNWLAGQMKEMHSLTVEIIAGDDVRIPDADWRLLLFQTVRELLFNVVKHAETDRARVELVCENGSVLIRVSDDGRGFEPTAVKGGASAGGFGLSRLEERLGLFGATLSIESGRGRGTRAAVWAPLAIDGQEATEHGRGEPAS